MAGLLSSMTLSLALASLPTSPPRDAAERCEVPHREPVDGISTIALAPRGLPHALDGVVERAVAEWNAPSCNRDGDLPRFTLGDAAADRTIEIDWIDGISRAEPTACGSFSGKRIRLYRFARDPRSGLVRSCGSAQNEVAILAHELGHALGLGDLFDPGCPRRIMSQLARHGDGSIVERRVQPEECLAAGEKFVTAAERGRAASPRPEVSADLRPTLVGAMSTTPAFSSTYGGSPPRR